MSCLELRIRYPYYKAKDIGIPYEYEAYLNGLLRNQTGEYSRREIEAMDAKMNNPAATVICPRCGKELHFKDYESASEVICETSGCLRGISGCLRGIIRGI